VPIDIIRLTEKGLSLSHSVRRSNDLGWNVIYFLAKNGNQSTRDRIGNYCFGGDMPLTNRIIKDLKARNIVVGV
jgi:hypothetical protein